jgi:hypothetical protein
MSFLDDKQSGRPERACDEKDTIYYFYVVMPFEWGAERRKKE